MGYCTLLTWSGVVSVSLAVAVTPCEYASYTITFASADLSVVQEYVL